jgi:hypothetical protein
MGVINHLRVGHNFEKHAENQNRERMAIHKDNSLATELAANPCHPFDMLYDFKREIVG